MSSWITIDSGNEEMLADSKKKQVMSMYFHFLPLQSLMYHISFSSYFTAFGAVFVETGKSLCSD